MALHFVGFRDGSQLWRAMQIFGVPDFLHVAADARFVFGGELDPDVDTVVFADAAKVSSLQEAKDMVLSAKKLKTVDDSGHFDWHFRPLTRQVPW